MAYHSKYTGAEVDALLDKVESGEVGGKVTVDSALSTESENPVMNKVITVEVNNKADKGKVTAALNTKADKNETDTKLATLSEETNARFAESAESTSKRIIALENKADNKFADVDSEIENLKRGEAYVMGESLVFRNYADATIIGNTFTL